MSGYSFASTDVMARRAGLSFGEMQRRRAIAGGRAAARKRRLEKARQNGCVNVDPGAVIRRQRWDLRDEL